MPNQRAIIDGDHDLAFATQKFENAWNAVSRVCTKPLPVICDAESAMLRVTGFSVDSIAGKA
ncbi:MAG: hypothetical protein IPK98_11105 [Chloracidobacterium sp.]|nr:hypothetical protein [Chloracidobacterium sp.]